MWERPNIRGLFWGPLQKGPPTYRNSHMGKTICKLATGSGILPKMFNGSALGILDFLAVQEYTRFGAVRSRTSLRQCGHGAARR